MTYEQSIPIAKQLAEKTLAKGFDVEAFLILNAISNMNIDKVPESDIDESIDDIQSLFIKYMKVRNTTNLKELLCELRHMLSELYLTCDNQSEKTMFKEFLCSLQNIYSQNTI